ncbi:SOS response-associated peptidase family protein [Burkholderia multivorans]|nr:SOS response-associated peptidase family protein [Burkholderia multivorans]
MPFDQRSRKYSTQGGRLDSTKRRPYAVTGYLEPPRRLEAPSLNVEKAKAQGRKPPRILDTMNVRYDNLAESRLYSPAWRAGRRCLIPAKWICEPNWETGKHIPYRIGVAGWRPLCVAGIWRTLQYPDGTERHTMAMVTVSADEHPIMKRMHRPGAEKRSVVILHPDDWEEWLTTPNLEAARAMLQLYPAEDMAAGPA